MSIVEILFLCFIIAIGCISLFYLVGTLVHANRNYKETKEKYDKQTKETDDFWEKRRQASNKNFDELMAEFNRRNEESMNRIREHIKRMEQEQVRRAEEARHHLSSMNTEKQKLLTYMNVVGISNYPFTKEEIAKKRRILSLKYHPDRNGGKDSAMKRVNEACDYLEKIAQG